MTWTIREGDAIERLGELEPESVQTVVTSPPYWGLRDYGDTGQLGLEPTPEQYVANLVEVFREVSRVLRKDGTVWLNLGDSYANPGHYKGNPGDHGTIGRPRQADQETERDRYSKTFDGLKNKDLCGIPWRVAFALQADGWWLRSDIIWAKPNPMPESVTDRPTRAHEYLFLLTKSARYYWDADAIREPNQEVSIARNGRARITPHAPPGQTPQRREEGGLHPAGRNRRSVWEIATAPYAEAHFATFPPKLVEPCILAGSPPKCCGDCGASWERVTERKAMVVREGPGRQGAMDAAVGSATRTQVTGTMLEPPESQTIGWRSTCAHDDDSGRSLVLDPFCGSGTAGVVALRHDRSFIGIELNPAYCELARNRIRDDAPLMNYQVEVP